MVFYKVMFNFIKIYIYINRWIKSKWFNEVLCIKDDNKDEFRMFSKDNKRNGILYYGCLSCKKLFFITYKIIFKI